MSKFAKLLNDHSIKYDEIQENISLKKLSVKLKNTYIKDLFLSKELFTLYLTITLGILFIIYGFNAYNDSVFLIFYIVMITFLLSCLVFMVVYVAVKIAELYQQREFYCIYGESETPEIVVNLLKKNAAKEQCKSNGKKYFLCEIYEAADKNDKNQVRSFYEKVRECNIRFLVIVFEGNVLHKSPILLVPTFLLFRGNYSNIVLRKFLFDEPEN